MPPVAEITDAQLKDTLRRRASGAPAWHDAHSPLHTRELVQLPTAGTIIRVATAPLIAAATREQASRLRGTDSVRVRLLSVPERPAAEHATPVGTVSCLPEDPVTVQAFPAGLDPVTVTVAAGELGRPVTLTDPARKGEPVRRNARALNEPLGPAPGDGLADLTGVLAQAARRGLRRLIRR